MNGKEENVNSSKKVPRMVDITEISAMVAAAGILVGVVYYVLDIRNQAKARQTDLILRLYTLAGSKEFTEALEKIWFREIKSSAEYAKEYGTVAELNQVWYVYGVLGMLLQRKLVDIDIINDVTGRTVIIMWEKLKHLIEPIKKARGLEWDSFEYLANEMKKREQAGARSG